MTGSWGMGGSFGRGFGALDGQKDFFYPTDLVGALYFIDPHDYTSLTPGAAMKASGGAPPAVTLSGTKASRGALRIEATSATQFKWGYDNDGTSATSIQTGQTIPNPGTFALGSTGLTATFPSGTYANAQVWEETVSDIKLRNDSSKSFAQATASLQPKIIKGINGVYCLRFDGVDDTMFCSTVNLPTITVGLAPIWCWGIMNVNTFSANAAPFAGNSSNWIQLNSTTQMQMVAAGNGSILTYAVGTAGRWIAKFTGANLADSSKWRATAGTVANTGNGGGSAGVWIGSLHNLATTYINGTLGAQGMWTTEPTGTNLSDLETWGSAAYGSGLF